ncbi:MAG TPA: DUF169 domain-containing protein [Candidatus Hydrogenedentes bacterium]|nr:DUF169 domain-containing protein [Candidatus Hydrogenedentota bacterium]HOL77178.1 DUF169 domain-containing protein [Candidatus Hydrogenedentota bacterium]HPO85883.1 DUF169 domain-containing protein [Candidatus Hydrogenedentota bacterium]
MDMYLKQMFLERWQKYFPHSELPIVFYYTDDDSSVELADAPDGHRCFLAQLGAVRQGKPQRFDVNTVGCEGGKRYLGFSRTLRPNFEYFLSCGIPGQMEGERYKKSPELVRAFLQNVPDLPAPGRYIVFKRWDLLEEKDEPVAVIFYAKPDVLSGLFTLANYDEERREGVIAPFCAGCGSIVQYPLLEQQSAAPRAVIGMFDVSARPFVPRETLSFAIPMKKFVAMVQNMDESFLITGSWEKVRFRL